VKYSFDYNPPAPVLRVRLSKPSSGHSIEVQSKIDTGADITVIPQSIISELKLIPASRVSVSSFDGREEWKYTYFVNLSFDKLEFSAIEVIGARRRDALLGRDILNLLKTILDGKNLDFDFTDP